MLLDYIRQLVGQAPVGFEYLEYTAAVAFALLLFKFLVNIFASFAKFMGYK